MLFSINSFFAHPYIISNSYIKKFKNHNSFLPLDNFFPSNNDHYDKFKYVKNIDDIFSIDFASHNLNMSMNNIFSLNSFFDFINNQIKNETLLKLNLWFSKQGTDLISDDGIDNIKFFLNNSTNKIEFEYLAEDDNWKKKILLNSKKLFDI